MGEISVETQSRDVATQFTTKDSVYQPSDLDLINSMKSFCNFNCPSTTPQIFFNTKYSMWHKKKCFRSFFDFLQKRSPIMKCFSHFPHDSFFSRSLSKISQEFLHFLLFFVI